MIQDKASVADEVLDRLTGAMMRLSPADQQRLTREVQGLMEGGTQLIDQLAKVVQW